MVEYTTAFAPHMWSKRAFPMPCHGYDQQRAPPGWPTVTMAVPSIINQLLIDASGDIMTHDTCSDGSGVEVVHIKGHVTV